MIFSNNEQTYFTRRYFNLPKKVLLRDSKIAKQLVKSWDVEKDESQVFKIFLDKYKKLSSQRYWELLRTVWILCGGLDNIELFKELFSRNIKNKYCFSTPEEQEQLRNFPLKITVYRACNNEKDNGISWTISKDYAEYYKKAFNKDLIISKEIHKDEIFAYINRNKESEIILLN